MTEEADRLGALSESARQSLGSFVVMLAYLIVDRGLPRALRGGHERQKSSKQFYVIVWNPRGQGAHVGIHHAPWADVAALLPGSKLAGSGITLRGFETSLEAFEYWLEKRSDYPTWH